ncbi:T9SS C-terminal target domain-containing protein, partial [Bacteroidetes/Chlorobi group bacterium ChocPot_Mid]
NNPKNFLYAGTYRGVYYSNDDMTEWVLMNENLPNNTVNELEISYPDNKIIAATYGRGFWMADLIEGNVGIDGNVNFENLLIDILPNPSDGNLQMILNLNHNAVPVLNLEIIDILGRKVYNEIIKIDNSSLVHNLNLDLLSGQYFLKVSYANNMKVKKFIISK